MLPFALSLVSLILIPTTSSLTLTPKRHASFFGGASLSMIPECHCVEVGQVFTSVEGAINPVPLWGPVQPTTIQLEEGMSALSPVLTRPWLPPLGRVVGGGRGAEQSMVLTCVP